MRPGRDGAPLDAELEPPDLPAGVDWYGDIAFLDRDGVLDLDRATYINRPEELELLPGAAAGVAALRRAGFRICVVTNQSPIGRGWWGHERLASIHAALRERLLAEDAGAVIDLLLYCPHAPEDECPCRKPAPGLLVAGAHLLGGGIDEVPVRPEALEPWLRPGARSFMIGDRPSDVAAGLALGVRVFDSDGSVGLAGPLARLLDDDDDGDAAPA